MSSSTGGAAPLFLIGFMGSGKSTVGRLVAARLGHSFRDLDQLICKRAGQTVAEIFASEGEPGFRRREAAVLKEVAAARNMVIATGGGAACNDENLRLMRASGRVVALLVSAAEVLRRVGADSGRPLLAGAAGESGASDSPPDDAQRARHAAAETLLKGRARFYAQAHYQVDTHGKTAAEVAEEVVRLLDAKPS